MLARPHVVIGAAATGTSALLGASPGQCAVLAVISAGSSLLPDLDSPTATATKILGKPVHRFVKFLSTAAQERVSTSGDRSDAAYRRSQGQDAEHRGLTHTAIAACMVGAGAALVCLVPHIVMLFAGISCLIAMRPFIKISGNMLARKKGKLLGIFAAAAAGASMLAYLFPVTPLMAGMGVATGWMSHILADGCTKDGIPLLWPLLHRGKRWWRFRFLGTRLSTGGRAEWLVACGLAAMLASPALRSL